MGSSKALVLKVPYLGKSYQSRRDVVTMVIDAFEGTLVLAVAAMILATLMGIAMGTLAAYTRSGWLRSLLMGLSMAGVAAPSFLVSLLLAYLLGYVGPLDRFTDERAPLGIGSLERTSTAMEESSASSLDAGHSTIGRGGAIDPRFGGRCFAARLYSYGPSQRLIEIPDLEAACDAQRFESRCYGLVRLAIFFVGGGSFCGICFRLEGNGEDDGGCSDGL